MKYSSVIALLLATSNATKVTQRGVLPPPDMVASSIISTVDMLDQEVKRNKKDLINGINGTERSIEGELKRNLGLTLPPNTLPSGEIIVDVVGANLDAQAKGLKANQQEVVREITNIQNDMKRTADQMNLGSAEGAKLVDQNLPPADFIVNNIEQSVKNIVHETRDPNLAGHLDQGINEFKRELKRAGGDADENFPTGKDVAGVLKEGGAQLEAGWEHNKQNIKDTVNGVRQGLVGAARDLKLAQVQDPNKEKEVADEVEREVDAAVNEARKMGYKVRIPRNEKEMGKDLKEDLAAFEKEIKRGDFDKEIREVEELAKKDGKDFDMENAKEYAEHLIEEEEGELSGSDSDSE